MKKNTLFAAVAVLALASPLAIGTAAAQRDRPQQSQQQQGDQRDRANDQGTRNDQGMRNDHRDRRENWRDERGQARWDDRQHNGYYINSRWTYGEPAANLYGRPGFALGYQPWTVGQNLGQYYGTRFQPVDYRREQLRRPQRGMRWVQDDRGDYLLVNRAGRIMQVVVSGNAPRDRRQSWRESRNDARWDDSRYNGYYRNNIWTYGAPPEGRYSREEIVYGYQPWQSGQRLGYYEGRYQEVDYRTNDRLRQPPRGYHWVRSDGGDLLLAAIAGGLITAVILNNSR